MKNFLGGLALGLLLVVVAFFAQTSAVQVETAEVPFEFKIEDHKLPPVEDDAVATLDGYNRTVSADLCRAAQVTADKMAAGQAHRYRDFRGFHTQAVAEKHGAWRENICWVSGQDSWETAYQVWKASSPHEYNRQNGGHYIGYAKATNGGVHYYVVLYGSKP